MVGTGGSEFVFAKSVSCTLSLGLSINGGLQESGNVLLPLTFFFAKAAASVEGLQCEHGTPAFVVVKQVRQVPGSSAAVFRPHSWTMSTQFLHKEWTALKHLGQTFIWCHLQINFAAGSLQQRHLFALAGLQLVAVNGSSLVLARISANSWRCSFFSDNCFGAMWVRPKRILIRVLSVVVAIGATGFIDPEIT
jgi:hypothetical protein